MLAVMLQLSNVNESDQSYAYTLYYCFPVGSAGS
jgi:hypothetical protein